MVFVAALTVADKMGRAVTREHAAQQGRWLGVTFALIALATVVRIGVSIAAITAPEVAAIAPALSATCWVLGAGLMWLALVRKVAS